MPDLGSNGLSSRVYFYPNCNCCSGSGSSGSSGCYCTFFQPTCNGSPVVTGCQTDFVLTVRLSVAACGSSPLGSCGSSGSSTGGGPSTGGDFDPSGSGSSGSCSTTCPDCCDLFPRVVSYTMRCGGSSLYLVPSGYCDTEPGALGSPTDCKGYQSGCTYFYIEKDGLGLGQGIFAMRVDQYYLAFTASWTLASCNPVQINGTLTPIDLTGLNLPAVMPCLMNCLAPNTDTSCITGTFTITE
jgi:hypothetical protein